MPRTTSTLAALAFTLLFTTVAGTQGLPAGLSPARAALWREIRAVNDSMEAAFSRGNMKAVAAFYADDAKMTGGSGPMVEGRSAIDAYWREVGTIPGSWRLEVRDIGGSRDLAYQRGHSRLTQRDTNGRERVSAVDFVVIWRREPGGQLRIWMDLY